MLKPTTLPSATAALSLHFAACTEKTVARLAQKLADLVVAGDIILLDGDLGSGKTFFARAFLRHFLGDPKLEVPSPTYALVQPYALGDQTLLHADLYRLQGAGDLAELGLFDDPDAIVLVEWPQRAEGQFRRATFSCHLKIDENGQTREVTLDLLSPAAARAPEVAAMFGASITPRA